MSVGELLFDAYGCFVIIGTLILFFRLWFRDKRRHQKSQQRKLDAALWKPLQKVLREEEEE